MQQDSLGLFDNEAETPETRVCVVGGGSGIGLAVATRFLESGARVHISEASAETLARILATHPGMHGTVAESGRLTDIDAVFSEARAWLGNVDVLVYAVAALGPRATVEEIDPSDWQRTLASNLNGAFYAVRAVAKGMRERGQGVILFVASSAARTGLPMRSAYVASMAGLVGLAKNLARELGPDNVRCNAILPGFIESEATRRLITGLARERQVAFEEAEADFLSRVSMRSWVEESEVAEMAMFLATDAGRHVTGQAIGVCGGVEWEG